MSSFVDLRTNGAADQSHGGFWPSFTDIMMVVVMIFMFASVVLIMRNWDLVQELRTTMEAERLAEEMARNVTETNATLEEQLAQAQYQLSEMRMRNMQLNEESLQQRAKLAENDQQLLSLDGRLRESEDALQRSQDELGRLTEQYTNLNSQLLESEERYRQQSEQLTHYKQESSAHSRQLNTLQEEYDTLKVKYDKLVKPARTAKGKYVVEVRYEKRDDRELIYLKDRGEPKARIVSSTELHSQLEALKKANPGKLYIKIIIPSDSGLSYSEAWKFMKGILEKYDYYYQS